MGVDVRRLVLTDRDLLRGREAAEHRVTVDPGRKPLALVVVAAARNDADEENGTGRERYEPSCH
jgi:hypothetical protein